MPIGERIVQRRINPSEQGKSLLGFLSEKFTYHSQEEWLERINSGKIFVNANFANPEQLLRCGDIVSYDTSAYPEPEVDANFAIIFENNNFMIIDKPGNLPVHPSGPFFKNTLWHHLRQKYAYIHFVNRLDRESSGVMIAAKNKDAAAKFAKDHEEGKIRKEYLALVFGNFPDREINAEGFIYRDPSAIVRKKMLFSTEVPQVQSQKSITIFRKISSSSDISLLLAIPISGRMHQIRATLLALGYPIVGDKLYGLDENIYLRFAKGNMNSEDFAKIGCARRQMLHSYKISFVFENKKFYFSSPAPSDMQEILSKYRLKVQNTKM